MDTTLRRLDGIWTLYYAPEKGGRSEDFRADMLENWPHIAARVPGCAEQSLADAGLEGDPFYDENLLNFAKYEYTQWIYQRRFEGAAIAAGRRAILRFDGIDTVADVYLNGAHIGRTENMLIEHEFDVTDLLRPGENELIVHIHSVMNFARNKEYNIGLRGTAHRSEICWTRKAAHCFGWDILPRLVTSGLWRGVSLIERGATRFTEVYYAVPVIDKTRDYALLEYAYRFATDADTLEGFSVRVSGRCGESEFTDEQPAWFVSGNCECRIQAPRLWWPRGYGEAALYDVRMELVHFGEVVDVREERIGLRTVRLERDFTPGRQKFAFFVNDVPIMVRGTNWVPLDAVHARDMERLERAFALVKDSGCNMMRSWGGGVYESDRFFELCDESGVMVWQDFCMGNTNYPQGGDFARVIEEEAAAVIRRIRNHASLAIWSGDNEIDTKNMGFHYPHYDARYNRVAHETLVRALEEHDPYRYFVRSSPEIPDGFNADNVPEQHTWGPRAFFKDDFYRLSSASFIGEAGYHGCPAPSSLREFLKPEHVWPMDNRAWAMHSTEDVLITRHPGSRNRLMADQVALLCAEACADLDEFALISQISQAEAMKFFIEHTRILKWKRTGIIWWNMIDGWPQISDAVVDYYYRKKLAYHYIKRSQKPRQMMLDEVSGWDQCVVLANDTREDARFVWSVSDADTGETLLSGETDVPAGENARAGSFKADPSRQRLLILRFTANGVPGANHYLTGWPKYHKADLLRWLDVICALDEPFDAEL